MGRGICHGFSADPRSSANTGFLRWRITQPPSGDFSLFLLLPETSMVRAISLFIGDYPWHKDGEGPGASVGDTRTGSGLQGDGESDRQIWKRKLQAWLNPAVMAFIPIARACPAIDFIMVQRLCHLCAFSASNERSAMIGHWAESG